MRPFRLLLSLTSCLLALTLLFYISLVTPASTGSDHHGADSDTDDRSSGLGLGALFSFHGPLFPPSAIISLTDDNSTFFLARPAAFGPLLPSRGLSGQLWIGSGFADDAYHDSTGDGELGCGDVPRWEERYGVNSETYRPRRGAKAALERKKQRKTHRHGGADLVKSSAAHRADSSLRDEAEIAGKVVLLSRGGCGFLEKVQWAQRRGGVAVIIGDNIRGGPIITMYARGDTSNITTPALFTSRTTAQLLSTLVPKGNRYGPLSVEVGGSSRHGRPHRKHPRKLFTHKIESAFTRTDSGFSFSRLFASWFGRSSSVKPRLHPDEELNAFSPPSSTFSRPSWSDGDDEPRATAHAGLWVTLTPTNMSSNPFLDTLLVLVVSPLVTLTVVYALLLLRSRMQRRRWRAPKSLVERLPVRTYHTLSSMSSSLSSPSSHSQLATPAASTPTTPLLQSEHRPLGSRTPVTPDALDFAAASSSRGGEGVSSEHEKRESGLAEWRRRYGGRQKECVVCLEEYEDGVSRVMSLPCGHEFHAECITPWLTTRRRTCPICKGDVVRSLARHSASQSNARSPSPPDRRSSRSIAARRWQRRRDGNSGSNTNDHIFPPSQQQGHHRAGDGYASDLSDEDVQTQAALRRNDSPSAARPIPIITTTSGPSDVERENEDDLERGESVPRSSAAERSTIWRAVGSWTLPGLSGRFGRDGRDDGERDRRDR